jgi:hypothetical protein
MIKRAISLFIVIALAFSFGALSIGAYNETDKQLLDALFDQSLQNDERIEEIQYLLNQMKDQNSEAWRDSSLAYQTMAEDFDQFYNYFKNEFLPRYEASGGQGTTEGYSDPNMEGFEYYVHCQMFARDWLYHESMIYCNLSEVPVKVTDKNRVGLRVTTYKYFIKNSSNDTWQNAGAFAVSPDFALYYDVGNYIIDHNLPLVFPDTDAGRAAEEEYGDLYQDPETSNTFDPSQLTPDELIDLLDDAATEFITGHPDYTTVEGILRSILAILQQGQKQGLETTDLQELAEQLGCQCPTEEQINAAILTVMGNDERSLTDVYKVLLDVKNGTNNLDEILHELRILNGIEIAEEIDETTEEFTEDFSSFVNSLIDMLSSLRGTGEVIMISNTITQLQNTLLLSKQNVSDITIDLSFVGAGTVTFIKASDFYEGGPFYTGLLVAKGFVGIVLILIWLHAARKKYIAMMETAGYGG